MEESVVRTAIHSGGMFNNSSRAPNAPPVKACLFDMDGLLIDSEDIYSLCTNELLREHNRPDLTWSLKARLQGRPAPEAARIFHDWAQLPVDPSEFLERQTELQKKHFPRTKPLPGVSELLDTLKSSPSVAPLALATSSHAANFELKTSHLEEVFSAFAPCNTILGDDPRIARGRGKPAPDIYLLALKTINERVKEHDKREILAEECLVFEDSVPGVESGLRAGMQVVWCPHPGLLEEYRGRETNVLVGTSAQQVDDATSKVVQNEQGDQVESVRQGRARLFTTLEDFPYHEYGIDTSRQG